MFLLSILPRWRSLKLDMLKRLLIVGHVRSVAPAGPAMRALPPDHRTPKQWADYKPYALLIAIIDQLYTVMFKVG